MSIDYEALKKQGFLKQKQEGFFIFRTRKVAGNYSTKQLIAIAEISKKYGKEITHATTRQGIEIPHIRFEDVENVAREAEKAGINFGASGPSLRAITCCPGNNWCRRGLVNTFALSERVEKELGIKCGMELPHKFKIAISGCPNTCTRAQVSEIGIHGEIDMKSPGKKAGYSIYLGGCGGRTPRTGFKLDRVLSEEEALEVIKRVVEFYKRHAKPRQRLAFLIEEVGRSEFLGQIGF